VKSASIPPSMLARDGQICFNEKKNQGGGYAEITEITVTQRLLHKHVPVERHHIGCFFPVQRHDCGEYGAAL